MSLPIRRAARSRGPPKVLPMQDPRFRGDDDNGTRNDGVERGDDADLRYFDLGLKAGGRGKREVMSKRVRSIWLRVYS
jgi:hypothetical protein